MFLIWVVMSPNLERPKGFVDSNNQRRLIECHTHGMIKACHVTVDTEYGLGELALRLESNLEKKEAGSRLLPSPAL